MEFNILKDIKLLRFRIYFE